MTKLISTRQMCVRLRALGIPKQQTDQIIQSFVRWTNCSGPEWTVERLKALKLEYVSRLAGKPVLASNFERNKDGFPSGVWSWLLKQSNKKDRFKVLNVLSMYSTLTSPAITEKQKKKFFGSMCSEDKTGMQAKIHVPPLPKEKVVIHGSKPFLFGCTSPSKSAPSVLGTSIRSDDSFGQLLFFTNSIRSVECYHRYPLVFDEVVPKPLTRLMMGSFDFHLDYPAIEAADTAIGKIGFIQEPGFKLRAVANPNAVWQVALDPLKDLILQDLKENFPTDCTHDQMSGVRAIQGWLKEKRVCFSVDLSDATNLMPRTLQMDALRNRYLGSVVTPHWRNDVLPYDSKYEFMGSTHYDVKEQKFLKVAQLIDVFQEASESPWMYKDDADGKFKIARFTRGQPLGLGPSFASFALAHNLLLIGICERVGVDPLDTFRILGDDIVISDNEVHRRYRATLRNLGCVVSEHKSVISDALAEFAGQVITPDEVIPTYKWRRLTGSNFLDVARNYGRESRRLLSRNQRMVVDLLAEVPEQLGGFGWNPEGKTLSDRLATPVSQWLIDRALRPDENQVLVQYRTLTSMWHEFMNSCRRSSLIPTYQKADLLQYLWAGDLRSTRSDLLEFWRNDAIQQSVEAESVRIRNQLPTINTTYIPVKIDDSWFSPRFDEAYGWLLPIGISQPGDPRTKCQTLIMELADLVSQSEGISPKEAERRLKHAFARESMHGSRPSYEGLVNRVQRVGEEARSSSVTTDQGLVREPLAPKAQGLRR